MGAYYLKEIRETQKRLKKSNKYKKIKKQNKEIETRKQEIHNKI